GGPVRLVEGQVRPFVADHSGSPPRVARRSGLGEGPARHGGDVEDEEDRDRRTRASRGPGIDRLGRRLGLAGGSLVSALALAVLLYARLGSLRSVELPRRTSY